MIYELTVRNREISHDFRKYVVQNGIDSDQIKVKFDSEWSGRTSYRAVFTNGSEAVAVSFSYASTVTIDIPWEVLQRKGALFVSFVSYKGDSRIVTKIMDRPICVPESGSIVGDASKIPTKDAIQEILDDVEEARQSAVNAASDATAAAGSANSAATNANSKAEAANTAASSASGAATSANNAASAANTAAGRANSAADEAEEFLNGFVVEYDNLSDECKAYIAQVAGSGASVITDEQGMAIIDSLIPLILTGHEAGTLSDQEGLSLIDSLFS